MSTGSFISFILMLILILVVVVATMSKVRDLQRRVGQLEQQIKH